MTVIAQGRSSSSDPPRPGSTAAESVRVVVAPPAGYRARDGAGAGPAVERQAEFTAFMAESSTALARTAWFLCGDEHQAEELVQQAFVRVWNHWGKVRQGEPLAYARKVLSNLRIDSWRKHRREVLADPGALPEGATPSSADVFAERDLLVRALARLSRKQRRVVVLRHLEGLSEKETAATLGVSVGTVKSQSSRGLAKLRGLMDHLEPGHDQEGSTR